MNARLYDPVLGRFAGMDPYVQMPDNTQNFNRYSYALNNPLIYTDPSGEFIFTILSAIFCPPLLPAAIGADLGMWQGGSVANGTMNPAKWGWGSGKTWGYMFGGAAVGGLSGAMGGAVAASGAPMANTLGIMTASWANSLGTYIYTGGKTDLGFSFGIASYNFSQGEWGYLGKKGNKWYENMGYAFGALGNLPDIDSLFTGGGQNISVNSADTKGLESDWWGHSSITDEKGNRLVSVGPDSPVGKSESLSETWQNSIKGAKNWDTYFGETGTSSISLNNISTKAINNYASGITRWDLLLNSCVGHTSRALWSAGVPNIYLFHPHMLNFQLFVRQLGINSSPYLYKHSK